MDRENVSAALTVAVPAARVFAVLADPATHAAIDGTGWIQEAVDPGAADRGGASLGPLPHRVVTIDGMAVHLTHWGTFEAVSDGERLNRGAAVAR